MGCLILLLLVVVLLGVGMWIAVGLVGVMLTLLVAGLIGWAADALVPGRLPGGWLGAVLTGIAGGFVGHLVLGVLDVGDVGPVVFGVDVVPAFLGALIIAAAAQLLSAGRPGSAR